MEIPIVITLVASGGLRHCELNGGYHVCADADVGHLSEFHRVDHRDDALIFGEDVDDVDGNRIDGPVFVTQKRAFDNGAAVCRQVKSVVVLRRETMDGDGTTLKMLRQLTVAQQIGKGKVSTLDPKFLRLLDARKDNEAAVARLASP